MNSKKLKGAILVEVIISAFLVSIITMLIMVNIHSQLKISNATNDRQKLSNMAMSAVSHTSAGENYMVEEGYELDVQKNTYNDRIGKVKVLVRSKDTGETIVYEAYYEK